MNFSDTQREILARRGISEQAATAAGVRSIATESDLPAGCPDYWTVEGGYLPGLLFEWHSPSDGVVAYQLRPDEPVVGKDGDVKKYVFGPGSPSILHAALVRDAPTALIVEGTCQTIAAATYAPDDVDVYGIAGCRSWSKDGVPTRDLGVVLGRDVLVALDADAASNPEVYEAGVKLREACLAEGAESVRFLRVPGGGKTGLDDLLGSKPEEQRAAYLERLISLAVNRPKGEKPELPAATKPKSRAVAVPGTAGSSLYFAGTKLLVATLAKDIVRNRPAAITKERKIALYRDGVFRIDGLGFTTEVTELLGEDYRDSHERNAEKYALGQLAKVGAFLPERMEEPLVNCSNVMVDLRTGETVEHDPRFRSTSQLPIPWNPDATCPMYEEWTRLQIGDQLDDLEESVSVMLDPTLTPTKAVFLFGPSRSGKSTYLRLMQEIAGADNTTGVSLHELVEDKFARANLYGKTLNVSADLSSAHVEDLSIFKLMTGEDLIHANRKYGGQFDFVNRALFLFSANELPTVGESSRAYSERIKPFHFGTSFAGREDPWLEAKLRAELPGILVRLVRAHQRRMARGTILPTNEAVRQMFEQASDRVRQFVAEACEVVEVTTGKGGSVGGSLSSTSELYNAFREWAADEGKATMAKSKMKARLSTVPGVVESVSSGKSRGWNVRVLPRREWSTGGTLSVLTHPTQRTAASSPKEEDVKDNTPVGRKDGSKRTKFHGLPSELRPLVAVPPTPECPDCDGLEELVPPTNLWYACRHCHPGTFAR